VIIILAVWSIIAWTLAFVLMVVMTFVLLPLSLIFGMERVQYPVPARIVGSIVRLTLSRVRITVHPDVDWKRVSVFVQNHVTIMDAHVALNVIRGPFCGLENASHLHVPFYGWLMRMGNAIPVHSRSSGRTSEITAAAKERAGRGISVLTFPEGHRTLDGTVRPFKRGAFFMARDAGLPIVPIAVRGLYDVLSKGKWIVNPGTIDVYIGKPRETTGISNEGMTDFVEETHRVITAWVERRDRVDDETTD
jgi:1-acyl-sn-glycerol-3-phosphate acyltransferase